MKNILNFLFCFLFVGGGLYAYVQIKEKKEPEQKETPAEELPAAPEDFEPKIIETATQEWDMPFQIKNERTPHFLTIPYNDALLQKVLPKCFIEQNGGFAENGDFVSNPILRREAAKAVYMLIANAYFEEGVLIGKTRQELPTHTALTRLDLAENCPYASVADVVAEKNQFSWLNSGKIPEISPQGISKLDESAVNVFYALSIYEKPTCNYYYNERASSANGRAFFDRLKKSGQYLVVQQVSKIIPLNGVLYTENDTLSPHQALCPVELVPVESAITAEQIVEKFKGE